MRSNWSLSLVWCHSMGGAGLAWIMSLSVLTLSNWKWMVFTDYIHVDLLQFVLLKHYLQWNKLGENPIQIDSHDLR